MNLDSYELRNPGRLIAEVADRVGLTGDHAYLVLVEDPPGDQPILGITELTSPALIEEHAEVIDELRNVVHHLTIPEAWRPPRHMVVRVLMRPGWCDFMTDFAGHTPALVG